jgi:CHAD domain-containing protein
LKKKDQKKYVEERWKNMQQHFFLFCHEQDPTALHQMRVMIKKIHSLVKLHTFTFPEKRELKLIFKPVRKIFKNAGIIRESQLHLLNLEKTGIRNEQLEIRLNEIIRIETEKFLKRQKKYGKILDRQLAEFQKEISPITKKQFRLFVNVNLKYAFTNLQRKKHSAQLHESRKSLKSILHLSELFIPETHGKKILNIEYLTKLAEKIGGWHDLYKTDVWLEENMNGAIFKKPLLIAIKESLDLIDEAKSNFKEQVFKTSSSIEADQNNPPIPL